LIAFIKTRYQIIVTGKDSQPNIKSDPKGLVKDKTLNSIRYIIMPIPICQSSLSRAGISHRSSVIPKIKVISSTPISGKTKSLNSTSGIILARINSAIIIGKAKDKPPASGMAI